jgi:hypothetical protein
MRNGRWGGQPGTTSRHVSVVNWLSWPHVGPMQDHLNWERSTAMTEDAGQHLC